MQNFTFQKSIFKFFDKTDNFGKIAFLITKASYIFLFKYLHKLY